MTSTRSTVWAGNKSIILPRTHSTVADSTPLQYCLRIFPCVNPGNALHGMSLFQRVLLHRSAGGTPPSLGYTVVIYKWPYYFLSCAFCWQFGLNKKVSCIDLDYPACAGIRCGGAPSPPSPGQGENCGTRCCAAARSAVPLAMAGPALTPEPLAQGLRQAGVERRVFGYVHMDILTLDKGPKRQDSMRQSTANVTEVEVMRTSVPGAARELRRRAV